MALIPISRPHMLNVVWREDGSGLQGLSMQRLERFELDGEPVPRTTRITEVQAVSPDDAQALAQISADLNTAALASIAALSEELNAEVLAKQQAETARDAALAQVAQLRAQIAAYAEIPSGEWLQRWTAEERQAVRYVLAPNSPQIRAWLEMLDASPVVHLDHVEIQQGTPVVCAALEQIGVIAPGQAAARAAAITAI